MPAFPEMRQVSRFRRWFANLTSLEATVCPLPIKREFTAAFVPGRATALCFADEERFTWNHSLSRAIFPEIQRNQEPGHVIAFTPAREMCFERVVQGMIGRTEESVEELSRELVRGRHAFTLPAVEEMVCDALSGKDVGIALNGLANQFFVEGRLGEVMVFDLRGYANGSYWNVNAWNAAKWRTLRDRPVFCRWPVEC